jgi:nitroreductase
MELREAIYTLRSMRRVKPDPIPDEAIRAILDAAIRAPSGSNQQHWAFLVVRDRRTKDEIGAIYRAGWQAMLDRGYGDVSRRTDLDEEARQGLERVVGSASYLADHIAEAPVWIFPCLLVGDRPATLTSGASIYPAVQNLMLAARELGIGSTLTTIHKHGNDRVNELLGLPAGWDTAALIPLGYPRGKWGQAARRPVEEVAFGERFGQPLYG